jgi:amidohydrolase
MNASDSMEDFLKETFYWLHRHPELSFEEVETTKHLRHMLEENGIRILDLPLKTGLVAEIGHGEPVIALRADIDALPITEQTGLDYASEHIGVMHACGHDFHTTSVLGAALLLKEREQELHGTIRIVFQPAEEAPGGAKLVLKTGVLAGVSAMFGLHCSPRLPVGTIGVRTGAVTASVDRFVIHFIGRGAHAAHPETGIDPIPIAAAFVQAAQTIVSRNLEPFDAGLVSITHIEAGNTWNVIPEEALVEGTTRSMTAANRKMIKERLYAIADGLAVAHGARAVIDWYAGPPATNNTPRWAELAGRTAKDCGLTVIEAPESLAGEDFAFYQETIPGCFVLVGTGKSAANHNAAFRIDPCAIYPTAEYLTAFAKRALGAREVN